jgi:hypothetical protein
MRKVKQFTLRINGRGDLLAEITTALWEKGVNILAFASDVQGREGLLHLVADTIPLARKIFAENGWDATEVEVVIVSLPNKPGSLALLASKLTKAGVKIEYVYTGPGETRGETCAYLGVSDLARALEILR